MTQPPLGSARVTVHADTDPFEREVQQGVRKGAEAADDDLKLAGKDMGDALTDSMGDQVEKKLPGFFKKITDRFRKEKVKVKTDIDVDVDRGIGERISDEIHEALIRDIGGRGGIGTRFGQALADAVGAGFNISGRSPLIAALIPAIGFIGFLIVGLLEGATALVATLTVIPSLLIAIGLQAGALILAFQGVGTAIQGAFAAKNAKELNEAIKGLSPSAQAFVKSLLPLKELFKTLKEEAQEAFFKSFGTIPEGLIPILGGILTVKIREIASALGWVGRTILIAFSNPQFIQFLNLLAPATVRFLDGFAQAVLSLSSGFTALGIATMPFFESLGRGFNQTLIDFGKWLQDLSANPEFLKWLQDMRDTLTDLSTFTMNAFDTIKEFLSSVSKAGGDTALKDLNDQLERFKQFLQEDVAIKGLEGLVNVLKGLSQAFIGLLALIILVSAALQTLAELFRDKLWPEIQKGLVWFITEAAPKMMEILNFIGFFIFNFFTWFWRFLGWLGTSIGAWLEEQRAKFWKWLTQDLPRAFKDFADGAPGFLYQAGRNVIQGLINGINSMIGNLKNAVKNAVQQGIKNFLPWSPAKEGPLAGTGDPVFSGQEIVKRLAMGMTMEAPALKAASTQAAGNIIFGPGAVKVGFEGAVPTAEQAQTTGAAAGRGIVNALAMRNTRLQVRTM